MSQLPNGLARAEGLSDPSVAQLNAGAQQLVGTSLQAYGGLPNPRAAVEALQSNSAPAVSAAMTAGSSEFDSILNSSPIAGPLQNVLGQPQPAFAQQPQQRSADEQGMGDDWKSLNGTPQADSRWLQSLLQSQDGALVKKWQNYLNSNQWYSGRDQLAVSGHWDTNSVAALYSFLIARFTPAALYSQDTTARQRAQTFLYSIGYDAQGLSKEQGADPQFKNDIVVRWLHTHGPDTTARKSLDEWSRYYGDANLSDAVRGLKEQWFQSITDAIPFIGQLMPWSSAHTADISTQELNDAEKAALAPALQDAHNSMGFMGWLNGWDQLRTKAILGVRYFFGDLFGQGKVENPWDGNNSTGQFINAHANDLFAGLFGDKLAQQYPALASVGNLFMNIADDPISYIGVGLDSKLVALGEGDYKTTATLRGGMAGARAALLKPAAIRDAFARGQGPSHLLDTVLQPMNRVRSDLSRMLGEPGWNTPAKASALLGERNPARVGIVQQILDETDAGRREALLQQHYGYKIFDPSFAMNMMQATKTFSPAIWGRLSEGKQARLWWSGIGSEANRGRMVNLDDPFDLRDQVHLQGVVHNLPEQKVDELMNKSLSADVVVRSQVVEEMNALIRRTLEQTPDKGAGLQRWVQTIRGGRRSLSADDQQFYLAIKDPGGNIVEASRKGTAGLAPEEQTLLRDYNDDVEDAVHALKDQLVQLRKRVGDTSPEFAEAEALTEKRIEDLRATQQPQAAFSPQFSQWQRWQYTPYEVIAYNSPVLRRADFVQRKMKLDAVMSLWKRAVLFKPASSLSIVLGDESTRFWIDAFAQGRPQDVAQFLVEMVRRKGVELPPDLAFSAAKAFGEYFWDDHIPYDIDSSAYIGAATHYINDLVAGGPEAKVWTRAMKDNAASSWQEQRDAVEEALMDWLTGSTGRKGRIKALDPDAREFLRRAGIDPDRMSLTAKDASMLEKLRALTPERGATTGEAAAAKAAEGRILRKTRDHVRPIARQIHGHFMAVTKYQKGSREDLFDWVDRVAHGGRRFSEKEARDLVHRLRSTDPDALPVVVGRRLFAPGSPGPFSRMSDWYFHHVTDALVNNQRRVGYGIKLRQYEQRIRSFHGGDWSDDEIMSQAHAEAKQWVMKNTYQGARSMTATALRNVFPFMGATANMSRFYMRQWARHPALIDPSMRFEQWQSQNSQNGGLHIPIPGLTNLLSVFGFNSGDDLTFDPSYAFFFSRDGLSGFLPGLGPVAMLPVKMAAQQNPDVASILKQFPGFEYVDTESPMIPWAERLASAAGIAFGGKSPLEGVPLIGRPSGYYSRRELDAAQQQHAQFLMGQRSQDVTEESVRGQVAAETGLQGVLSAGLPLNMQFQDPQRAKLQPAVRAFDAASTDQQKLQVVQQFPEAAPLLLYYSPGLWNQLHPEQPLQDSDVKRTLAAEHPWLQAYATGKVASSAPGTASGAEFSQRAYQQDLASGRLRYLETPEFIGKMLSNDEMNDAWSQYEVVHHSYMSWLLNNGVAPASPQATAYRQTKIDPAIEQIGATHPDWYKQFVQQTDRSFSGQSVQTMPLRSLMSWEVMPAFTDFEGWLSNLWRQALVYRDNAATALLSAKGNSGEQQLILASLQQQMQELAATDPSGVFAAQLNRFSFSKLSDLTNLEEEQLYTQALAGAPLRLAA